MNPEELLVHANFLNSLAQTLVHDPNLAEEIEQETWLAALKHPSLDWSHPRAWFTVVARNVSRTLRRRENRLKTRERQSAQNDHVPSSDEIVAQEETRLKVIEAVLGLEEPYRSVIVLRFYKDLPHKEVARRLNLPVETMRTRLKKAVHLLRKRLDGVYQGDRNRWHAALAPFAVLGVTASSAQAVKGALISGVLLMTTKVKIAALLLLGAMVMIFSLTFPGGEDPGPMLSPAPAGEKAEALPSALSTDRKTADEESMERESLAARNPPEAAPAVGRLTGLVVDDQGAPLPGVRIEASAKNARFETESRADGCFDGPVDMQPGQEEEVLDLAFSLSGYAPLQKKITAHSRETVHLGEQVLLPAGTVCGRVIDLTGRPVPHAEVEFRALGKTHLFKPHDLKLHGDLVSKLLCRTTADEEGAFVLEAVPAGRGKVWAHSENTFHASSEPLELRARQVLRNVEVKLEPFRMDRDGILGQVIYPDGNPVPEAGIRYSSRFKSGGRGARITADQEGAFRYIFSSEEKAALEKGEQIAFSLEAADRENRFGSVRFEGTIPETNRIILELIPQPVLSLVIRWDDCVPESVAVTTSTGSRMFKTDDEYMQEVGIVFHTEPEAEGRSIQWKFHGKDLKEGKPLEILAPQELFTMKLDAPGFKVMELGPYDPDTVPQPLRVMLEPAPGIRGQALSLGNPVKEVRITLHPVPEKGYWYHGCDLLHRSGHALDKKTRTDGSGRFMLDCPRSGAYYVRAEHPAFSPVDLGPLTVDRDQGMEGLTLELLEGGNLEGWLLASAGRRIDGLIVTASRGDGFPRSTRTDSNGYYHLQNLTPGPWSVQVTRTDATLDKKLIMVCMGNETPKEPIPWNCHVDSGRTTRFDLSIQPCILEGRIMLNNRVPEEGRVCMGKTKARLMFASEVECELDPAGRFRLERDKPGEAFIELSGRISDSPMLTFSRAIELEKGDNPRCELEVELGALQITDLPARFIHNHTFEYQWTGPDGFEFRTEILPDPLGVFLPVATVPAGKGTLVIKKKGQNVFLRMVDKGMVREIDIPAGSAAPIRLGL